MKKVNLVLQILLGLMLVVFGLNKFFGFLPMPAMPGPAGNFMGALLATGYMIKMVGVIEVLVGALLLLRKFVALSLVFLAPISVNIVAFHLFLDLPGIGGAAVVAILNLNLLIVYRAAFKGILKN
ncbi:DoxX protein [Williamwhitmania taraxaci]|uniref:DoxX protein n=1 Tax=Williamwhitmania taraxaci TaxID=1640674 RepID=A0A1G6H213_9BACT|nr:DoxX protein [Williamwhitmania taraxaci]SDB88309.1 hypothetical protein SAMN05216323_100623 [Williamwhitmania taraxaci]